MRDKGDLLGDDCHPDGAKIDCHRYGGHADERVAFPIKGHRTESRQTEAATCFFTEFKGKKLGSSPDTALRVAQQPRYVYQEAKTDSGPNGFGDFSAEGFAESREDRSPLQFWSFWDITGLFDFTAASFETSISATEFLEQFNDETHTGN
jgi:hypothetical protein